MLKIKMQTIGLLRKIVHENGIKSSCGIVYKIITVRRDVTNENIFFFKSSLPPPDFQSIQIVPKLKQYGVRSP
jgi:hypothetical protein